MIYEITSQFPKEELYGLVSQLRRAVVSIPSNIAEGYQRGPFNPKTDRRMSYLQSFPIPVTLVML